MSRRGEKLYRGSKGKTPIEIKEKTSNGSNICVDCEWVGSKLVCMTCHSTEHVTNKNGGKTG
jgi:hypothetical protein